MIKVPLVPPLHKLEAQDIVHAVEELYFFARYDEAVRFTRKVLDEQRDEGTGGLDQETRDLLRVYEARCLDKIGVSSATQGAESMKREKSELSSV